MLVLQELCYYLLNNNDIMVNRKKLRKSTMSKEGGSFSEKQNIATSFRLFKLTLKNSGSGYVFPVNMLTKSTRDIKE